MSGVLWDPQRMFCLARPPAPDKADDEKGPAWAQRGAESPPPECMDLRYIQQEVLPQYQVVVPQQDSDAITDAGHDALLSWALMGPLVAMLSKDGLVKRYK